MGREVLLVVLISVFIYTYISNFFFGKKKYNSAVEILFYFIFWII